MQANKPTSNKLLKSINQQKVLRLIYTDGPISRVELAEKTGLTQQTITNIVNRLLQDDIVLEMTPTASSGGRKPVPLVIDGSSMYAIGVEVAVEYVRGSLMDFQNKRIYEVTKRKNGNEGYPLRYIIGAVDELLQHVPDRSRLKGIGCSIQGLVDSRQGTVIYSPGLGFRNYPLRDRLEEAYGLPVLLENDVNLLALVENLKGTLAASQNNITIKLDYGIGGAIVANNQLCAGANHVAGEFGHYKVETGEQALKCHCGAKGCLTTIASISGLRRSSWTLENLRAGVSEQEPEAKAKFKQIVDAIGIALGNVITFLNPEHVLLTGALVDELKELLVPELKERIRSNVPETCRGVELVCLPATPNESISAAGLVINEFFDVPLEQLSL
ncbi:ROK family transcriptional regulator [Paenibacillus mesophilus]|uniref:ROK family transcriptional regulator n=1 Tax=Paenibacillus mesophilus TaxID=2582849 RepID=UPI00110D7346|nr:ROK family transcriptional regulator [Paenibacillus mesophilus]TMV52116.1 ROK family transcriptional regulator [Paenibacillus mesophilus]